MDKCKKHPKFNGRKKPKHECLDCLNYYFLMKSKPRVLPKPTKIIASKKTYNRRSKDASEEA